MCHFFFFKQKTAYEMRISDWSSDVCSSDLRGDRLEVGAEVDRGFQGQYLLRGRLDAEVAQHGLVGELHLGGGDGDTHAAGLQQRSSAELHVGALVERTGAGAAAVAEAQSGRAACRERGGRYV